MNSDIRLLRQRRVALESENEWLKKENELLKKSLAKKNVNMLKNL